MPGDELRHESGDRVRLERCPDLAAEHVPAPSARRTLRSSPCGNGQVADPHRPWVTQPSLRATAGMTAAYLVKTLYRGLADNVAKAIEGLLRNGVILVDEIGLTALGDAGATLPFRSAPPPANAVPSGSPRPTPFNTGAASCPSTPPPSRCSIGGCTTPRRHHRPVLPHATGRERRRGEFNQPAEAGLPPGRDWGSRTAVDTPMG